MMRAIATDQRFSEMWVLMELNMGVSPRERILGVGKGSARRNEDKLQRTLNVQTYRRERLEGIRLNP